MNEKAFVRAAAALLISACSSGVEEGTSDDIATSQEELTLFSPGVLGPPRRGSGYQITVPAVTLAPGQEAFRCYHAQLPASASFLVGQFESAISYGSELSVYQASSDSSAAGTFDTSACTPLPNTPWLFDSSASQETIALPSGVAIPMSAQQRILVDLHYINTTGSTATARATVNVDKSTARNPTIAGTLVSFNTQINVPPFGTQTVAGDCTPPVGSQFFAMTMRTHRHAVLSTLSRKLASGALGETFVSSTDYAHPASLRVAGAPFVQLNTGESLHYKCSYQNDTASSITVGTSSTSEICMAVSYYFPAADGGKCN